MNADPKEPADLAPTLRSGRIWLVSAVLWPVLGAAFYLHERAFWSPDQPLWPAILWETVVQWGPYVVVTPVVWVAGHRLLERNEPAARRGVALAMLLVTAVFAHLLLRGALQRALGAAQWIARPAPKVGLVPFLLREVASGFPFQAIQYVAVLGVTVALAHGRNLARRMRTEETLRRQLVDARLAVLQSRLQPHFLFNTLHAIGVSAASDPAATTRMVTLLGDLLRRALEGSERPEVTLREELETLHPYLEIQRVRFQDRLRVEIAVPAAALECRVPNLLLQPLVENAIRHGIERRAGAGSVRLSAGREGDALVLRIDDDGPGLSSREGAAREGVGLGTTRERLRALHDDAGSFELRASPGGTTAEVRLPWRTGASEAENG